MARGTVVGEGIVSQAATDEYRREHERIFGNKKPTRGRWVYDVAQGKCVPADEYEAPESTDAAHAPIIADRIHEGTTYDDGTRRWDLGSRRKRREFMRETGNTDRSDYGPGWRERRAAERERSLDRKTERAFDDAARKLHNQGKLRD